MKVISPIFSILILLVLFSCNTKSVGSKVENAEELMKALKDAKEGSTIVMANGIWKDVEINLRGQGKENNPIVLKAETPGEVVITGKSNLRIGGTYLEVHGLHFKDGFTPSNAVIEFKLNDTLANHCRLTNCVIEDYNQLKRDRQDLWVLFHGRHNQMDHCFLAGKSNQGPTLRVSIAGNASINNYHDIVNNHFGPRPRKGGPKAETIQIGDSYTSMSPSYTNVSNNLFERCNGEVEVISSKTNFNEFRNNVFYKCEGSVVTRHGNYCTVDRNYFIGDETRNIGGVRIINTGHWVTNNYFYNLRGTGFLSPLAVMNGIPKSPLNRYNQVTDAVIAYNTWVNCESPWHFGIGSNIDQKDVLPKSEIRSAIPIRTSVANNIIYNDQGDQMPVVEHDRLEGIDFRQNVISNGDIQHKELDGLKSMKLSATKITDEILVPKVEDTTPFMGFDFETIDKDLFGNKRDKNGQIGAMTNSSGVDPNILDYSKYGPSWFDPYPTKEMGEVHFANNGNLMELLANAESGDTIELTDQVYQINSSLSIDKELIIRSNSSAGQSKFIANGLDELPLFQMKPKGNLTLTNVDLSGNTMAFAPLQENMSSQYNLDIKGCSIEGFEYVLKGYKETFANDISFTDCSIKNCANGIELSAEKNNKGDYNVEFLSIDKCTFENVKKNVVDYYRGGYDESTIGGNLSLTNSTFTNCGQNEENKTLINTHGIINVNIAKNTFTNNRVKLVALLWGAKNNIHAENVIKNSGEIRVEENLKQALMY